MRPKDTKITNRHFFLPKDLNKNGSLFGGSLMAEMDKVAAMVAERHAGTEVVTACMDHLFFEKPINIKHHIILKAMINYVGNTSMEIGVRVEGEDPATGERSFYCKAYFTFVALKDNKPVPVQKVVPKSKKEKYRYNNALERVEFRKKYRN